MSQVYCIRRRRKGKHLQYADRQELEYMIRKNHKLPKRKKKTQAELATALGVSPATISRELKRGRVELLDTDLCKYLSYSADIAQDDYEMKATSKGPELKIGKDHTLARHIENKIINKKYSPDAVIMEIASGKYEFETSICTRTLYNYIEAGVFSKLTNKDLPRKGKAEKGIYRRVRKDHRNAGGKSISERPEEANDRLEYGHWEMDCIESGKRKGRSCLLVLVERRSRETLMFKLRSQTQAEVLKVLNRLERSMGRKRFSKKFKSITVDNGSEFLHWAAMENSCLAESKLRTAIYYCHPYSSWERGTNEQVNGHIRRFIPKGSCISKYTNKQIKQIEFWLNNYPRKILDGKTAFEVKKNFLMSA